MNAPADRGVGTRTLLFSDIEGSSRLERAVGTDAYAALLGRHRELLRAAFVAHRGDERGTEGDSFFVVFESASDAVAAAVDGQRALEREPWPDGARVRVRMGLDTGDVRIEGGDAIGMAINRAARIAAAGHGGQVLVSDATQALGRAENGPRFRDLGLQRLKDFEPLRLYQLEADGLAAEFPALRSASSPFAPLPAQPTSLIGRTDEIAAVRALLGHARLVTLTGPGGTGKTRLGLAVADAARLDYPDGVGWVGLSAISDPALVPAAFAAAAGVADEGTADLADAIAGRLRETHALLVVDNFEQVQAAASFVGQLLSGCPDLALLVTSRGLLHLAGEQEYPVPPLGLPAWATSGSTAGSGGSGFSPAGRSTGRSAPRGEPGPGSVPDPADLLRHAAVALFVERARAVRPDFALTADLAPAIVAICARLEGLPLAIELAAARTRLLSPPAILDRLERSLGVLAGGAGDLPDRQRTLRGAIAWSHDLLEPPARSLFARLSVFAGGWPIDAVEPVCDPAGTLGIDPLDGLESLVDQSLVRPAAEAPGVARFRMLHVVREFGLEALAASGDASAVRDRHLAWVADLAARAEPHLLSDDAPAWLDELEVEHDNLRTALSWALESGDVELGMLTAGRLWRFWHRRGHLGEGLARTRELLDCPGAQLPTLGRAKAINGAGGLAYWQNDFVAAQAYYEEYLALVRRLGDRPGTAEALINLGYMAAIPHDFEAARRYYEEAVEVAGEIGDRAVEANGLMSLGMMYELAGETTSARPPLARGIELARSIGDRYRTASGIGVLGRVEILDGRLDIGAALAREALAQFAEAGDSTGVAMQIDDLGEIAVRQGRPARALVLAAIVDNIRETLSGGAPPSLTGLSDYRAAARSAKSANDAERADRFGRSLDAAAQLAFALSDDDGPTDEPPTASSPTVERPSQAVRAEPEARGAPSEAATPAWEAATPPSEATRDGPA
jgi:predicted ATPase/class 3 adenylate cyclase